MFVAAPIFLISGAPGAGKSTFAKLIRGTKRAFIFETDNFFVDSIDKHTYHFDPNLLGIAHNWNQGEVIRACRDCPNVPVIVANTFAHIKEFYPYLDIARRFYREVYIIRLLTEHENVHNVPEEKVASKRLLIRSVTSMQVIETCKLNGYHVASCLDIQTDEDARYAASKLQIRFIQSK